MALTSTDQYWGEKLKIAQQETEQAQAESAQLKLMIAGATGQGGSPGQLYKPPVTNPGRGEAVFGTGKDGQRYFEFLKAMKINPNSIMLAHGEGRGPQPKYHDEYNRELPIPPWMQMDPSGKLIEIPWMKEKYMQEHPELFAGASSRQIRDRLKPFTRGGPADYDKEGGSLRDVPASLRPILLRDAMAQNLPANNIRRLQDTGHMTIPENADGTGLLRIIDSLGPPPPRA